MSEHQPTQFYARGLSGNFEVPIDESEINKQVSTREPARLPEEYSSPYLVPESVYEKAGRMALLGQASVPPVRTTSKAVFDEGIMPADTQTPLV